MHYFKAISYLTLVVIKLLSSFCLDLNIITGLVVKYACFECPLWGFKTCCKVCLL